MEALVVCQALFVSDAATCIKGKLVHDVHWSNAGVRDSVDFVSRQEQAIVVLHNTRDEFLQEFWFAGCPFVVTKG
jgi:hypothetical protein